MVSRASRQILGEVAELLRATRRLLFITGAGLSADSGLPTYRGIGGLYDRGETEEGYAIEDALSGEMLLRRPEVCWKVIRQLEESCRGAKFNLGHAVIARFEQTIPNTFVLTQNVDGFHHDAGSTHVIDIHGGLHHLFCMSRDCDYETDVADYSALAALPRCPKCGAVIRPEVVLFGEMLPSRQLDTLQLELARGFELVISIGTSAVFPYIAGPIYDAARQGKPTVEINPGTSQITRFVKHHVPERAAAALEALWEAYGA
ncbi:MAG: NAD-dependent protein deacylase [Deltaproteobacteria bacterium CG_4_9_14_3_um_filter_63_12]|nr:MAG: NAD-dependent protein deacylase [Deltaproteobacteria bacterium CG_4_9_14_3_um_filter_63_12]